MKFATAIGFFAALMKLIWVLLIAIIPGSMQMLFDRAAKIAGMQPVITLTQMRFGNAVLLIVLAFIGAYIIGLIFSGIWNRVMGMEDMEEKMKMKIQMEKEKMG